MLAHLKIGSVRKRLQSTVSLDHPVVLFQRRSLSFITITALRHLGSVKVILLPLLTDQSARRAVTRESIVGLQRKKSMLRGSVILMWFMQFGKISVGCGIGLWEIERGVIHWECGMGCSSLHYISLLSELGNIARNPNINNRGHLVIVKLGREVV